MPIVIALVSFVILLVLWPYVSMRVFTLTYLVLGLLVAFTFIRELTRLSAKETVDILGATRIDNRFRIVSWKKFIASLTILSFVSVPLFTIAIFYVL